MTIIPTIENWYDILTQHDTKIVIKETGLKHSTDFVSNTAVTELQQMIVSQILNQSCIPHFIES